MTVYLFIDVIIAYILDLVFGDPYWMPHPVRFIGGLIRRTERFLRNCIGQEGDKGGRAVKERTAGFFLMFIVVSVTALLVFGILQAARLIHPLAFHIANIYFIYSALAAKCLAVEADKVYRALEEKDIGKAREQLSMLVGRQTENLDEKEIIRGVVETTAENTVDGVISPLLYALAGSFFGLGAPLAYAFKAVSTLDSMVGYKNAAYRYFGTVSARLDDAANYLPARLSGLLIPVSAALCGKSFSRSFSIMLRDRRNHKSPNCAYPEAAVAGALGVRLGGANVYFGEVLEKPTIGDAEKELEPQDIKATIRIMYAASLVTLLFGLAIAGVALL